MLRTANLREIGFLHLLPTFGPLKTSTKLKGIWKKLAVWTTQVAHRVCLKMHDSVLKEPDRIRFYKAPL